MKSTTQLVALFAAVSALSACGGGGGDGGTPAAGAPVSSPSASPAPGVPSNDSPQAGSTTSVGNGVEGLWVAPGGSSVGLAFVLPTGRFLGVQFRTLQYGSVVLAGGTTWAFYTDSRSVNSVSGLPVVSNLYGSGPITLRNQITGTYSVGTPTGDIKPLTLDYSPANALAVTPADVVGTWSADSATVTVAAGGAITGTAEGGTWGSCVIDGSIRPVNAASSKNLFAVRINLSNGASGDCKINPPRTATQHYADTKTYDGYASVTFSNQGTASAPNYVRSLTAALQTGNAYYFAVELMKQ